MRKMKGLDMKKILIILVCAMFMMPLRAEAFSWKDFFVWLFGTSETTTTTIDTTKIYEETNTKLENIQKQANELEPSIKTSFKNIVYTLSTPNEAKEIETKLNAENADLFKIISDYQTAINSEKARILIILRTMADSEKSSFVKELNNLTSSVQKYDTYTQDITSLKTSLISQVSSSTDRTAKVEEINKVYTSVSQKASTVSTFTNILKLYAKLTGINV